MLDLNTEQWARCEKLSCENRLLKLENSRIKRRSLEEGLLHSASRNISKEKLLSDTSTMATEFSREFGSAFWCGCSVVFLYFQAYNGIRTVGDFFFGPVRSYHLCSIAWDQSLSSCPLTVSSVLVGFRSFLQLFLLSCFRLPCGRGWKGKLKDMETKKNTDWLKPNQAYLVTES